MRIRKIALWRQIYPKCPWLQHLAIFSTTTAVCGRLRSGNQVLIFNFVTCRDALKRENKSLLMESKKKDFKLAALQQNYNKQNKKHIYEMEQLQKRLEECENVCKNMEKKLETIFTKGQVANLKFSIKKLTWAQEDIANSITLYAASPKAYRLLYKKGFPLPGVRSLQKWAQKIDISRGLIKPVLKLVKASTEMDIVQKVCVLSFDEMKVRHTYCYDSCTDSTLEPAHFVQVAMLRGLMCKWKQPVFYDFNCKMTKNVLFNILQKCKDCGYNGAAIVCDLGGTNRSLLNELGINEYKPLRINKFSLALKSSQNDLF